MNEHPAENRALCGVIVFMRINIGSLSECIAPFLYIKGAAFIRLWFIDDNPFENPTLRKFDGEKVCVYGEEGENDIFCVHTIIDSEELKAADETSAHTEAETHIQEI